MLGVQRKLRAGIVILFGLTASFLVFLNAGLIAISHLLETGRGVSSIATHLDVR